MDLDRTGRDCALHPRIFFFRAKPPCSPQAEAADPPSDRLRGRRPPSLRLMPEEALAGRSSRKRGGEARAGRFRTPRMPVIDRFNSRSWARR